jgi:hypothetical protein
VFHSFSNFYSAPCVFIYALIHVYVYILKPYGRKESSKLIQKISIETNKNIKNNLASL